MPSPHFVEFMFMFIFILSILSILFMVFMLFMLLWSICVPVDISICPVLFIIIVNGDTYNNKNKRLFLWISKFVTPISVVNGDTYNNKICHKSIYLVGFRSLWHVKKNICIWVGMGFRIFNLHFQQYFTYKDYSESCLHRALTKQGILYKLKFE